MLPSRLLWNSFVCEQIGANVSLATAQSYFLPHAAEIPLWAAAQGLALLPAMVTWQTTCTCVDWACLLL